MEVNLKSGMIIFLLVIAAILTSDAVKDLIETRRRRKHLQFGGDVIRQAVEVSEFKANAPATKETTPPTAQNGGYNFNLSAL